jgi:hypothetical protein
MAMAGMAMNNSMAKLLSANRSAAGSCVCNAHDYRSSSTGSPPNRAFPNKSEIRLGGSKNQLSREFVLKL